MSKTLYLHIGTGKAGSTTIQRYLGDQKILPFGHRQIEALGLGNAWKIAAASGTEIARDFWIRDTGQLTPETMSAEAKALWPAVRAELAAAPDGNYVASSEYIISHYALERSAVETLKTELDALFDEVVLIVYLRNQIDYMKSAYSQMVKSIMRRKMSFDRFIAEMEDVRFLWDYDALLSLWSDVFGKERLHVATFDRRNFRNGNLLVDFLSRIDVDETWLDAHADTFNDAVENKSPSYSQIQMTRWLNHVEPVVPYDLIRRKIIMNPALQFGPSAFPKRHDTALLARVAEGNRRVNAAYLDGQAVLLPV